MTTNKKYNNKKKSMKRKNKIVNGGNGLSTLGSLGSTGSMGGPSIVDEMQNINPQVIITEIINNPEIKPHIMQFIDFLKNLDENQIDKELTQIINNKDNKYILNNIVFVLSKVPPLTPIFVSLKGSCMVETLTATGISTMLIPLHKKHVGNVIGIVKNSIGGVIENINSNNQNGDKINSQEIGNKIEKLINKLIDKEAALYHKYCEYSNDLKFGLVLMLPPGVSTPPTGKTVTPSDASSPPPPTGKLVTSDASSPPTGKPVTPSDASSPPLTGKPVSPDVSTPPLTGKPVSPDDSPPSVTPDVSSSDNTAPQISADAAASPTDDNTDTTSPESVEVKLTINGKEQIAEKVTGLGGLGCIFGNCIKLDKEGGAGTRKKKQKKQKKKKTEKKRSKK